MDPGKLSTAEWLELSAEDFKRCALEYAGKHYDRNNSLISCKSRLADLAIVFFLVEVCLWVKWAYDVLVMPVG